MAITPIVGPAGAGKSQYIAASICPGWIVVDFTTLYAALSGVQRGPDGKYPERETGDALLPFVSGLKTMALRMAVERELSGFVTSSSLADVEVLEEITGRTAKVIDPGETVIRARLADPVTGELSSECSQALRRWYRRS